MNILHVISEFDSYDAIAQVKDLANYLVSQGYNCILASSVDSNILGIDNTQIKYFLLPQYKNIWNVYNNIYRELKEIIKSNNIDIVHTHSALSNWAAFLACRHTDKPLVNSCYDFYPKNILNLSLALSKKNIVHQESVGRHLMNNFSLPRKRIQFIKQGLDLENLQFKEPREHSKADFNIGMISPLIEKKGHRYFLEAMRKVLRSVPNIKIWIVTSIPQSSHSLEGDLKLLSRKLGLSSYIEFVNNYNTAAKVLSRLNILVCNAVQEDASTRIILEAQACGVFVIAAGVAGTIEVVSDNETGLLAVSKDPRSLAATIIKALHNPSLYSDIILRSRQRIEKDFDIAKNIKGFIDTYKEVKNKKKVLVVNIGKIHDVISSIPAIEALKERDPGINITNLARLPFRCLLEHCPSVNRVLIYEHRGLFGFIKVIKLLIQERFDIVLDFNNSFKTHLLSYLSLANHRYGYADIFFRFFINHSIDKPSRSLGLMDDKLAVVKMLGIEPKNYNLKLYPSENDAEFVDNFLKDNWIGKGRIIGIDIPYEKIFFKNKKSLECLAYLCDKLASQHMRVMLVGLNNSSKTRNELFKRISSKPIFAKGNISALRLACLIKECDAYISTDYESLNLAMIMKVPSIVLSKAKDISNFSIYGNKNMEVLTIEDLYSDMVKKKNKRNQNNPQSILIEKINILLRPP